MKTFISEDKILEAVKQLKLHKEKEDSDKLSNGKRSLLDEITNNEQVFLQIELKKMTQNNSTYVHVFDSLPYPWQIDNQLDICLIVRDLNSKHSLPDRELDLRLTREHYEEILLSAGFDLNFIKQRISILPMRQLITEYRTIEAKSKLCSAYDIFLADHKLMNNRFKHLNRQLGSKFWIFKKKSPLPVNIRKSSGEELKNEILKAIKSTKLYLTGRGSSISVQFGLCKQTSEELTKNLSYILTKLNEIFGDNVTILRIKRAQSISIPIFADLGWKNDVKTVRHSSLKKLEPITDEFPLFNNCNVTVYPNGHVKLSNTNPEDNDDDDAADDGDDIPLEDKIIDDLKIKWIENQNRKRVRRSCFVNAFSKKVKPEKEQLEMMFTK